LRARQSKSVRRTEFLSGPLFFALGGLAFLAGWLCLAWAAWKA
jgi:uncharacterized membrane protein YgdD (TMEM256/DUF423 family)